MKSFSRSTPSFATFSAISAALRQKVCENSRASYRGPRSCQAIFPSNSDVGLGLLKGFLRLFAGLRFGLFSGFSFEHFFEHFLAPRALRQVNVLLGLAVTCDQRTAIESAPAGNWRQAGLAQERLNFHGLQQSVAQREVPGPPARSVCRVNGSVMKGHGQDRSAGARLDDVAFTINRGARRPGIAKARVPRWAASLQEARIGREGVEGQPPPRLQRRRGAPEKAQQIGVALAMLHGVERRHGEREARPAR